MSRTAPKLVTLLAVGIIFNAMSLKLQGQTASQPEDPVAVQFANTPELPLPSLPTDTGEPTTAQYVPSVGDGYHIGANDLLRITVYQIPDLNTQVRVASDGQIRLPILSTYLPAAGSTPPELARAIASALVNQQIAVHPIVRVTVTQVLSKPIIVAGAVTHPQVIQAYRPMTLLEVIARAGGPTTSAGTQIVLTDARNDPPTVLDLAELTRDQNSVDPVLTGGETVRVDPAPYIYSVGSFNRPGGFPLLTGRKITVLRLIALSEGIKTPADLHHALILHKEEGPASAQTVDIEKMLKHKTPDRVLSADDILYLPENGKRKALNEILRDVGQAAVLTTGYAGSKALP